MCRHVELGQALVLGELLLDREPLDLLVGQFELRAGSRAAAGASSTLMS